MVRTFRKPPARVRLNIYLPDSTLRRAVKAAAAEQDLSVSEYCVRAITSQLERDEEDAPARRKGARLSTAVENARRFRSDTFHGTIFKASSADLIRQARERRPA